MGEIDKFVYLPFGSMSSPIPIWNKLGIQFDIQSTHCCANVLGTPFFGSHKSHTILTNSHI
jgi:hypothetical protein